MTENSSSGVSKTLVFVGAFIGFLLGREQGIVGVFVCSGIGAFVGSVLGVAFGGSSNPTNGEHTIGESFQPTEPDLPEYESEEKVNACPQCGFSYQWNGTKCLHCHFQIPANSTSSKRNFSEKTGVPKKADNPNKIEFRCPNCQARYITGAQNARKKTRCRKCRDIIQIAPQLVHRNPEDSSNEATLLNKNNITVTTTSISFSDKQLSLSSIDEIIEYETPSWETIQGVFCWGIVLSIVLIGLLMVLTAFGMALERLSHGDKACLKVLSGGEWFDVLVYADKQLVSEVAAAIRNGSQR